MSQTPDCKQEDSEKVVNENKGYNQAMNIVSKYDKPDAAREPWSRLQAKRESDGSRWLEESIEQWIQCNY